MKRQVHVTVSGRVQGVSFRYYTQRQASALGVTGYVRNLANGDVEIVAEGDEAALNKLLEWARTGPPAAKVTDIEVEWREPSGEFVTFGVRHD